MSIVSKKEYLLVMTSGSIKGFDDYEMAKAYINDYYYLKTRDNRVVSTYDDLTNDFDDIVDTMCYKIGVEEGECRLYNTREIIEKIQEEFIDDDEKEEVISRLLGETININMYDYGLENIFMNDNSVIVMENYGDPVTGQ